MSRRSSGVGVLTAAVLICAYFIGTVGAALAAQGIDRQRLLGFTDAFLAESARDAASRASADRDVNDSRLMPVTRQTGASMGKPAQGATMPAMMPIIAPLFLEDTHFKSTLVLVNAASLSTYADVTLTATNGDQIAKERVQFTPHSQQRLDIGAVLASAASVATSGSISVMQSPDLEGMVILAQLSITYQGSGEPNYIDEELQMPSTSGSSVLRAVAERSQGSPLVAISSLSASSQTVTVQCLESSGVSSSKSVALLAGETLVTQACNAEAVYGADFETAMAGNDSRMRNSVGIALTSTAMPGEFAAFGLAPHGDSDSRYFSEVSFTDPKMLVSPSTTFTGVPVGTSPLLPGGKYVPELALANFSAKAVHAHVKYATTSGTSPSILDATTIMLPANTTRWVRLDSVRAVDGLQNSFVVDSDGAPGDLMAKLTSASDSQLHEVELPGKDELNVNNGGAHPWSLENGNESTLLLFNHGTASDTFNVAISTEGMTWQKAYQLAPMQTLAVKIGDLIQLQTKDDKGNTLPKNSVEGMVNWFPPDSGNSAGRMLVSNKLVAMARSFSCDLGDFLCRAIFQGNTTNFPIGADVNFGDVYGEICAGVPCKGTDVGPGGSFSYSWSIPSSSSSVIAITGPSNESSVSLQGLAVSAGYATGTVSARYTVNGQGYTCQFSASGDATVDPKILLGGCSGSDVTNATQTAYIGQQIALCASYTLPSGVSVNSQSWAVPGTYPANYVGGFNTSTSVLTQPTLNQQSTTFYWVTQGNSQGVTFTLNLSSGASPFSKTTFNVQGPTSVSVTVPAMGVWQMTNPVQGPTLSLGFPISTPGIQFNASASSPSGQAGTYLFVQVITTDNQSFTAGSSTLSCGGTGLDNAVPYPGSTQFSTSDSPALVGLPSTDTKVTWSLGATMYYMWRPGMANDIPVTLGYVSWQGFGDTVQSGGVWTVQSDSSRSANPFQSSSGLPSWSNVLTGGPNNCQ